MRQACGLDWVCIWQILSEGLLSPLANKELTLMPCTFTRQVGLMDSMLALHAEGNLGTLFGFYSVTA